MTSTITIYHICYIFSLLVYNLMNDYHFSPLSNSDSDISTINMIFLKLHYLYEMLHI